MRKIVVGVLVIFLMHCTIISGQSNQQTIDLLVRENSAENNLIWEDPFRVSENDGKMSSQPEIAVGLNGDIHIVWCDDRVSGYNILYRKFSMRLNNWSSIIALTNESEYNIVSEPHITTSSWNTVHVSWEDKRNDRLVYRYFEGNSWSKTLVIAEINCSGIDHEIVVDKTGTVYFFWINETATNYRSLFFRLFIKDEGFGEIKPIAKDTYGITPKAEIDSQNNIHLVWKGGLENFTNLEILYQYFDGTTWHPEQPMTISDVDDEDIVLNPNLAIDKNDQVQIIWQESEGNDKVVYYCRLTGTFYSERERLNGDYIGVSPDIAIESGESVVIIFYSFLNLHYRRYEPQTGWSKISNITKEPSGLMYNKIVIDVEGKNHIVWMDFFIDRNFEIYYVQGKLSTKMALILVIVSLLIVSSFLIVLIFIFAKKKRNSR